MKIKETVRSKQHDNVNGCFQRIKRERQVEKRTWRKSPR